MCTILTTATIDQSFIDQVSKDTESNPHGIAICSVTKTGEYEIFKTLKTERAIAYLREISDSAIRVWVHTRFSTTSVSGVCGTHMFTSGQYIYCHNGILRCDSAKHYDVDSQLIGELLRQCEPERIGLLLSVMGENYANVFIIDTKRHNYHVIRQESGNLHTDNCGNYSSNSFASVDCKVINNSNRKHTIGVEIPKIEKSSNFAYSWYKDNGRYWEDMPSVKDYEPKAKANIAKPVDSKAKATTFDSSEVDYFKTVSTIGHGSDFEALVMDYEFQVEDTKSREFEKFLTNNQKQKLHSMQKRYAKANKVGGKYIIRRKQSA